MRPILPLLLLLGSFALAHSEDTDPRTQLIRRLELLDLFRVDGGIAHCMEAVPGPVSGDTATFKLRRTSTSCPVAKPSAFKVVRSTGAVLEAASGLALEDYVQPSRKAARYAAPAWTRPPSDDPVCGDDPECSYITITGGGSSFRKR